jgi:hypothetical protein
VSQHIVKYKTAVRKKVASLKRSLTKQNKLNVLAKIDVLKAKLKREVDAKELINTIHVAEHSRTGRCTDCIRLVADIQVNLTLGGLRTVLQQMVTEEQNQYKGQLPSQTDLKRWALKMAVLEFYNSLQHDPQTAVLKELGKYEMTDGLAPDTSIIYEMWLRHLGDLAKQHDANQLGIKQLDRARERGIQQGGAFEKQLQRFKQEFLRRLINQ